MMLPSHVRLRASELCVVCGLNQVAPDLDGSRRARSRITAAQGDFGPVRPLRAEVCRLEHSPALRPVVR